MNRFFILSLSIALRVQHNPQHKDDGSNKITPFAIHLAQIPATY
jgi:hypothetical protein